MGSYHGETPREVGGHCCVSSLSRHLEAFPQVGGGIVADWWKQVCCGPDGVLAGGRTGLKIWPRSLAHAYLLSALCSSLTLLFGQWLLHFPIRLQYTVAKLVAFHSQMNYTYCVSGHRLSYTTGTSLESAHSSTCPINQQKLLHYQIPALAL